MFPSPDITGRDRGNIDCVHVVVVTVVVTDVIIIILVTVVIVIVVLEIMKEDHGNCGDLKKDSFICLHSFFFAKPPIDRKQSQYLNWGPNPLIISVR